MRRVGYVGERAEQHRAEHRDLAPAARDAVLQFRTGELRSAEPLAACCATGLMVMFTSGIESSSTSSVRTMILLPRRPNLRFRGPRRSARVSRGPEAKPLGVEGSHRQLTVDHEGFALRRG